MRKKLLGGLGLLAMFGAISFTLGAAPNLGDAPNTDELSDVAVSKCMNPCNECRRACNDQACNKKCEQQLDGCCKAEGYSKGSGACYCSE
jgi:hypothetical protein